MTETAVAEINCIMEANFIPDHTSDLPVMRITKYHLCTDRHTFILGNDLVLFHLIIDALVARQMIGVGLCCTSIEFRMDVATSDDQTGLRI